MTIILVLAGILICVLLSGFCSGSEMALTSCNHIRLENEAEKGSRSAKLALKLVENYDDTLSTILVSNNLVNIAASSLTTVFVILAFGDEKWNAAATVIVTILIIIFGETAPKIIGKKFATGLSMKVSPFIRFLYYLFYPVNFVVVRLTHLITKNIETEEEEPEPEDAQEELQSIIETAEDEGVIDSDQSEIASAAIDFSDVSADEAMTARVDVEAIDINDSIEEITKAVVESDYSRLPVYDDTIDHVIGILHQNPFLKAVSEDQHVNVRDLLMEPCFIYKTTKLPQVLKILRSKRQHLAIVTDEYSGTLGVITMEDVLEEIVGEIWDETDEVEEEVVERKEGEFVLDGDLPVSDFLELVEKEEEDFDFDSGTVGGWCIEFFGDFPKSGDSFRFEDLTVTVLDSTDRRVEKVLVVKDPKPVDKEDGE